MSAHDNWLAAHRAYPVDAFCDNRRCPERGQLVHVDYQEENGVGTITPEECDICGSNLTLRRPAGVL